MKDSLSRRAFLGRTLRWVVTSIPVLTLGGMSWRFLSMPLKIKVERKLLLGPLKEVRQGIQVMRDHGIALILKGDALKVVSLTCTHLGCIVSRSGQGFVCPCHGSRFDTNGRVLSGPAARPLEGYRLQITEDERVIVHLGEPDKSG